MATNFPGSIDSFTNPTSGDTLDSPSHAAQHANINDAMVAVQTRLGAQSGTIGAWTAYTPTIGSPLTIGNGSVSFRYARVNDVVVVTGQVVFGSTSAMTGTGAPAFSLPVPISNPSGINQKIGFGQINDVGTATYYVWPLLVGADVLLFVMNTSGTYARESGVGTTVPMTWTTGDSIQMTLVYLAA